jgi:hypothetical protein
LRFDARAKDILKVVENYPTDLLNQPFIALILKAAMDVMPSWVLQLIEKKPRCALQAQVTKLALVVVSEPIQWALDQQGVCAVARRRVAGVY